jgi:hypothetical protein
MNGCDAIDPSESWRDLDHTLRVDSRGMDAGRLIRLRWELFNLIYNTETTANLLHRASLQCRGHLSISILPANPLLLLECALHEHRSKAKTFLRQDYLAFAVDTL